MKTALRTTVNVRPSCLVIPALRGHFTLTSIRIRNTMQYWAGQRNCIVVLEAIFQGIHSVIHCQFFRHLEFEAISQNDVQLFLTITFLTQE